MLLRQRFVVPLVVLCITFGGLFLTSTRLQSQPLAGEIPTHLLDLEDGDDSTSYQYNYCQASRPNLKTYPAPKVQFNGYGFSPHTHNKVSRSTLVHSQLFIRHGDRTPITVMPLDTELTWECSNTSAYFFTGPGALDPNKSPFPYANAVGQQVISIPQGSPFAAKMWKGSCIPGQLTPVGAYQHRLLGAALRKLYVDEWRLLPQRYNPKMIHIRSTDVWRTKQSAENLMAGLYIFDPRRGESPPVLQIHTLPVEIDYLTMNAGACPRISQLRSALEKNSEVLKNLEKNNVEFNKELVGILGQQRPWSGYMDTIMPRICHGMPLQCAQQGDKGNLGCITQATVNRVLDNVNALTSEVYRDAEGVQEVLKLGIGPLVGDIKANLLAAKDGKSPVRLHFYSGHDTTVSPLLGMLDSTDLRWPPYASSLLIELWSTPKKGEFFVRVLYNHAVLETRSQWCDLAWCPLETFVAYLDRFIVKDLVTECLKK